jgi:hypothetical protein
MAKITLILLGKVNQGETYAPQQDFPTIPFNGADVSQQVFGIIQVKT